MTVATSKGLTHLSVKLLEQFSQEIQSTRYICVVNTFLLVGERVRACYVILRKHRRYFPSPVRQRQLSTAPGEICSFKFSGSMDPNKRTRKRNMSKPKWLLSSCL